MIVAGVAPVVVFLALLGACVWVGGFVAIVVVVRVARRVLERPTQVAFFRALGHRYIVVAAPALVVALAAGGLLLADRPADATAVTAVVTAAALVLVTAAGVMQARAMTRLRARAIVELDDEALATRVRRRATLAGILRAAIGMLSLALLALAAVLAD